MLTHAEMSSIGERILQEYIDHHDIHIIASVLNGYGASTFSMGNDSDCFTVVAAKGKQKRP